MIRGEKGASCLQKVGAKKNRLTGRHLATRIPIFGLDWHIRQSPAQQELANDPLQPYIQFEQFGWNGTSMPDLPVKQFKNMPIVFFHLPPPQHLYHGANMRVVWIPMWDQARGYNLEWWQSLPKSLRVVAFSKEVSVRAKSAGLSTLDLRFFKLPDQFTPANWKTGRVLFYWNRTGLVDKNFLSRLCQSLDIEHLIFRRQVDPRIPAHFDYSLPPWLGKTCVQEIRSNTFLPKREYMDIINRANVFIAPRASEGVGLTFIEALARGCAVFAFDAPTMNEYITHKRNGYLFQRYAYSLWNHTREKALRWLDHFLIRYANMQPRFACPVTGWQDWDDVQSLDLQRLGDNARLSQAAGFRKWIDSIPQYASFILDW